MAKYFWGALDSLLKRLAEIPTFYFLLKRLASMVICYRGPKVTERIIEHPFVLKNMSKGGYIQHAEYSKEPKQLHKVALISDGLLFSVHFAEALSYIPNVQYIFYGPKVNPFGTTKTFWFEAFRNYQPVWTTYRYPLQVLGRVLRDRPHIIHFDFSVLIFGRTYLYPLPLALLIIVLRILGYKVVITINDVITQEVLEGAGISKAISSLLGIGSLAYYKILSMGSKIIVHLKVHQHRLLSMCKVSPSSVRLFPYGVADPPRIRKEVVDRWEQKFGGKKLVLFLGTIAPRKGIEYLIEGFSHITQACPEAFLIIAGSVANAKYEGYSRYLMKKANEMIDRKRFAFLGYLKEEDTHCMLDLCKVVVLPYVSLNALSTLLYRVFQHRKPVIATRIDAFSEELQGYPVILLTPPKDSKSIAVALQRFLTERELEEQVLNFMHLKAVTNSWRRVAEETCKVYYDMLGIGRRWDASRHKRALCN